MDEDGPEGLEAHSDQIMTFLKGTYTKQEMLIQIKDKKGNLAHKKGTCILKLYLPHIITNCKNPKGFNTTKYPSLSRSILCHCFNKHIIKAIILSKQTNLNCFKKLLQK